MGMGKIIRFDRSRRKKIPNEEIKLEIMAAAARAANRSLHPASEVARPRQNRPTFKRQGVGLTRWNPSGTTIFNIGILAFLAFWFAPDFLNYTDVPTSLASSAATDTETARFSFCHSGGGINCVVDGDTIWYQGNNIRIADIDSPETHPPSCAREAELGTAATQRLQSLLNAGAFSVESIDRDSDRYGRQLRVLTRGGESIGGMLVGEGLARWYEGGRHPWC